MAIKTLAPHPFTLRQLQYVVAVADELSFRRAAERCHVSQPSLSAQLAQLEASLGVQLFERDRRRVLPTAAGNELILRVRELLVNADDLVLGAHRFADPFVGALRFGVIPTVSPYLLPHIAPKLREVYPKLTLLWTEDKTQTILQSLNEGNLDAGIVALEAELGEVDHEVIAADLFVLAAPPEHRLLKTHKPASLGELRDESVLLLDDGHCFREQALAVCSRAHARELEFRATSLSTLAQMVAAGNGVTLLPTIALATEVSRAGLEVRSFSKPPPQRTLALVWRKRSPLAPAFKDIVKTIRAAYPR